MITLSSQIDKYSWRPSESKPDEQVAEKEINRVCWKTVEIISLSFLSTMKFKIGPLKFVVVMLIPMMIMIILIIIITWIIMIILKAFAYVSRRLIQSILSSSLLFFSHLNHALCHNLTNYKMISIKLWLWKFDNSGHDNCFDSYNYVYSN